MNMITRFQDLRFAIGTFFSIIAVLLLLEGFMHADSDAAALNITTGAGILIFGVAAILLSLKSNKD